MSQDGAGGESVAAAGAGGGVPAGADDSTLAGRIATHLDVLCRQIDGRLVGTAGNRAATDYVAAAFASLGCRVRARRARTGHRRASEGGLTSPATLWRRLRRAGERALAGSHWVSAR